MAVEVVESFRSDARLFSLSFLNVTWNLERNVSKRLGFRKTLLAPLICYIFSWKWAVSFVMRWEWHRRKLTCLVQRRRYCGWLTFGIASFIYGKTRYVSKCLGIKHLLHSQDWNTQSRQNFQDWLLRRWEFHCNKLFTITAFYAAEGNTFLLISWTETWSVMLVHLNKKYYFSLSLVCLSNWYIYIWNLWFIVIF